MGRLGRRKMRRMNQSGSEGGREQVSDHVTVTYALLLLRRSQLLEPRPRQKANQRPYLSDLHVALRQPVNLLISGVNMKDKYQEKFIKLRLTINTFQQLHQSQDKIWSVYDSPKILGKWRKSWDFSGFDYRVFLLCCSMFSVFSLLIACNFR